MKLISWNVNGLRAVVKKGFMDFFNDIDADIFALQETKMQPHQLELDLPGYYQYFHSAERKGYSGTAVFTKKEPISVSYDFEKDIHNDEGRVMTLEYDDFYFVNAYVPNSQEKLKRLDYRMEWEDELRKYLVNLDEKKPVIYCGDLNVAHNEIDLKNPSTNRKNAGFSDEERAKFSELLDAGFSDTFRTLYPDKVEYSWWSYRFNARANNAGWRIDYFVVSDRLMDKVKDSIIYGDIMGSDHCPVGLKISMK
ncbi:MAG TPA: exodeoxyribonuclease III [Erysipelotrichaceae bacterium]|nr:exodeoxyribonuclease III [Erysipelotrichaceae bacterium]